jgi:hypothetical protein
MKQRVSFDFDGTLNRPEVEAYARELLQRGVDVWIVTSRFDANHRHKYPIHFPGESWVEEVMSMKDSNQDLWEVVDRLGIPRHHVRFTCMERKHIYLHQTHFTWHLDDNPLEFITAAEFGCSVTFVDVKEEHWKKQCDHLLQKQLLEYIVSEDEKNGLYEL